jgi:hypothetical protein
MIRFWRKGMLRMTTRTTVKENMAGKKKTEGVAQTATKEDVPANELENEAKTETAPVKRARTSAAKTVAKRTAAKIATRAKSVAVQEGATESAVLKAAARESSGGARATVVKKLLKNIEEKLSGEDVKASLGDYIRLVQLHKELDEEAPRQIKVTWVEPGTKTTGKRSGKGSESGE